jgi:hypothetical protein
VDVCVAWTELFILSGVGGRILRLRSDQEATLTVKILSRSHRRPPLARIFFARVGVYILYSTYCTSRESKGFRNHAHAQNHTYCSTRHDYSRLCGADPSLSARTYLTQPRTNLSFRLGSICTKKENRRKEEQIANPLYLSSVPARVLKPSKHPCCMAL